MGRYTLKIDKNEISPFVKADLRDIDNYTTGYKNGDAILGALNISGCLRITYKANKEIKTLNLAFNDKAELRELSYIDGKKIDGNNRVFQKYVRIFLDYLKYPDFYRMVVKSRIFNLKVKEYSEKYLEEKSNFSVKKLSEYLSDYNQLREVFFTIEAYKEYLERQKTKNIPQKKEEIITDEDEGHQEEFFTIEDYSVYSDYIESHNIPTPDAVKKEKKYPW